MPPATLIPSFLLVEVFCRLSVVRQLAHGVVQASKDVRRVGLALRVGLSGDGIVDGRAGGGYGVDADPENTQALRNGDRHLGHVTQGVEPGVDQHG